MGELLALFSALCYALAGITVRRGGEAMDRDAGHLLSVLVNAVLNALALGLRVALGPPFAWSPEGAAHFVAAGAFTVFLGRILWMRSIQQIGPARATAYKVVAVVFVLLGAVVLLGEPAPAIGLLGALLVLTGLTVMTRERASGSGGRLVRAGVWYGLASALSFAAGNLFRKSGMLVWPEAIAGAAIGTVLAAALTLAVPGAVRRLAGALRNPQGRRGAVWFLGTGLATSIAQFALYGAMGISPVWVVNLLSGTEPVFVALLSLLFLRGREAIGIRLWASLGLVCSGLALIALR